MLAVENSIDEIVAENAALHQRLDMQKIIQTGVGAEIMRLNEVNQSLRRIIAYILLQNNNNYRILHKTLLTDEKYVADLNLEVDTLTNDWLLSLKTG
jgi:hypothetical protein